ncbi:hypothetical protein LTS18_007942, partial [Coniosporium uncinatum]
NSQPSRPGNNNNNNNNNQATCYACGRSHTHGWHCPHTDIPLADDCKNCFLYTHRTMQCKNPPGQYEHLIRLRPTNEQDQEMEDAKPLTGKAHTTNLFDAYVQRLGTEFAPQGLNNLHFTTYLQDADYWFEPARHLCQQHLDAVVKLQRTTNWSFKQADAKIREYLDRAFVGGAGAAKAYQLAEAECTAAVETLMRKLDMDPLKQGNWHVARAALFQERFDAVAAERALKIESLVYELGFTHHAAEHVLERHWAWNVHAAHAKCKEALDGFVELGGVPRDVAVSRLNENLWNIEHAWMQLRREMEDSLRRQYEVPDKDVAGIMLAGGNNYATTARAYRTWAVMKLSERGKMDPARAKEVLEKEDWYWKRARRQMARELARATKIAERTAEEVLRKYSFDPGRVVRAWNDEREPLWKSFGPEHYVD